MTLRLNQLTDPRPEQVADSVRGFLEQLAGPTVIRLTGRDSSRCRMAITLLHGNEPSGLKAIWRLIKDGFKPAINLDVVVAHVEAAMTPPLFSLRQLPGDRDLNRCFAPPFDDRPGKIAAAILQTIEDLKPEAIVDIHNTSGDGPAFTLATELNRQVSLLSAFFSHRMIVTDLRMKTLMEIGCHKMPVVTIECGGAGGPAADECAYTGLKAYASTDDLFAQHLALEDMDIYLHPVRLELVAGCDIQYIKDLENPEEATADVLLPRNIDACNFGVITPERALGLIRDCDGLRLKNGDGIHPIDAYFEVKEGMLYPRDRLKLFMVTTNPVIAKSDCLLYAVREIDHSHFLTH